MAMNQIDESCRCRFHLPAVGIILDFIGKGRRVRLLADYAIADLQCREVVQDADNYLAEASIDIRGNYAVMVYGRYRDES